MTFNQLAIVVAAADAEAARFRRIAGHIKIGMPGQRTSIQPMPPATSPEAEKLRAERAAKKAAQS